MYRFLFYFHDLVEVIGVAGVICVGAEEGFKEQGTIEVAFPLALVLPVSRITRPVPPLFFSPD